MIYTEIEFDNIYSSAIGRVKFTSADPFEIKIESDLAILSLEYGEIQSPLTIKSNPEKSNHIIQFSCTGLINERNFEQIAPNSNISSYGMQCFPFISSIFQIKLKSQPKPVHSFLLKLPQSFRAVWFDIEALNNNQEISSPKHSQGGKESVYIFTWNPFNGEMSGSTIDITVPVRLGGLGYLNIVTYPFIYYLLSTAAIALLSLYDKPNVTLSSVGAAWAIMLRNFTKGELPQLNTILKDVYYILAAFLLFWAIMWILYGYYAAILVLPLFSLIAIYRIAINHYIRHGCLPAELESRLLKQRLKTERMNLEGSQKAIRSMTNQKTEKNRKSVLTALIKSMKHYLCTLGKRILRKVPLIRA